MDIKGARILVVGLGRSGVEAARLLSSKGAEVIGNDIKPAMALGAEIEQLQREGVSLVLGKHDAKLFKSVDKIVLSPGVPPLPELDDAEAHGIPVISEIELASWFIKGTIVGITGTNGKSTVTSLVGAMCRQCKKEVFVGGNLGRPLVEAVGTDAATEEGISIVEMSSFQLERLATLRVQIAVILNVSEDHLDRYTSFNEYLTAKGHIFDRQLPEDTKIVPHNDLLSQSLAKSSKAKLITFGDAEEGVGIIGDNIYDQNTGMSIPIKEIKLNGTHNLINICAAITIARLIKIPNDRITSVLHSFDGLPHRMQRVCTIDGVTYYDDSKATNVGAVVAAIDGLKVDNNRIVLIAGGIDKGGDYHSLRDRMASKGRALIVMGEAAQIIQASLGGSNIPIERVISMESAVKRARTIARSGDIVLLSPACASFDMFDSYKHRGEVFQRSVKMLKEGPK